MSTVTIIERLDRPRTAFQDRSDAGRVLAESVVTAPDPEAVVLALPRGGVPVGAAIADALGCEMRPVAVRKLPIPTSPEMGFGAVTLDGTVTLNHAVMREHGVSIGQAALVTEQVRAEIARRAEAYPGAAELPRISGRRVFVVDDGLATGYTMIATCEMVRHQEPSELIVAIPVAPLPTVDLVSNHCDELICLIGQAGGGFAVASFYRSFADLTDEEVQRLLAGSRGRGTS
jgi:putative phosphoribosyl transferase